MFKRRPTKRQIAQTERRKQAELEWAEKEARDLSSYADHLVTILSERQRRNHWRESIQQLIQGVH